MASIAIAPSPVGSLLRHWRQLRGLSQLALADRAEVSTRHISYVENGRAQPSRQMVLVLTNALDLPLRERNRLLEAAGFAAVYSEEPLSSDALGPARRAVEFLLERHEPYPAVAMDRHWNVVAPNAAAARLFAPLVGVDPAAAATLNAVETVFDPQGLRPGIVNWEEVAGHLVQRLHREAAGDRAAAALLERCLGHPGVPRGFRAPDASGPPPPLLLLHLRVGERELRFFTALTTLGTAHDVTLEELRIETWFPADAEAEAFFRPDP
jgi:transcriptional regulator with XRE-family HTH domain